MFEKFPFNLLIFLCIPEVSGDYGYVLYRDFRDYIPLLPTKPSKYSSVSPRSC